MKKFWIIVGSLLLALLAAAITIISVIYNRKISVNYEFALPTQISLYNKSTTKTVLSDLDANAIVSKLNSSMKFKKADLLDKNAKITTTPTIEINVEYGENVKKENRCILFEYGEEHSFVAHYNQNTKKISYTKLLIVLNEKCEVSNHYIYYANGSESFSNPVVFAFSEKSLLNVLDN